MPTLCSWPSSQLTLRPEAFRLSSISCPSRIRSYHALTGSGVSCKSCGVTGRLPLLGKKLIWPFVSKMAVCISLGSKYPATRAWPKNSFKSMDARERFSLKMVPLSISTSDRPLHKLRIKILRQAVKCTTQVTSPYTTMAVTGRYHCSRFVASSAAIEPVVTAFR